MLRRHIKELIAYLFLLPSLLGIAVFYVVPYIICVYYSTMSAGTFAGLGNYTELFTNATFLLALKNTVIFMSTAIPLLMIISFFLALFLNSFKAVSAFFRSSLLIPIVIPSASLISVWQLLFEDAGVINGLLNSLGLPEISFYGGSGSMLMIIFIFIWKNCGFCTVLFTAGLAQLPKAVYESARLDGASKLVIIRKITIPMITPTTFFVFLMAVIYSFKIFREVFVLFGEYPNTSVYFLQHFINNNYYNMNYSRLSSTSVILSVIIILVILLFFIFERKRNYLE
ncbi:MAG: carbohydrate ABC transporter permease [Acutalibacteraceae bacterium]